MEAGARKSNKLVKCRGRPDPGGGLLEPASDSFSPRGAGFGPGEDPKHFRALRGFRVLDSDRWVGTPEQPTFKCCRKR